LGIGDWGLGPIPNPQSPIPTYIINLKLNYYVIYNKYIFMLRVNKNKYNNNIRIIKNKNNKKKKNKNNYYINLYYYNLTKQFSLN